jgi:hypothetical protein
MVQDFHLKHLLPATPSQTENTTATPEKPKKTMTPAALNANRANAAKSTGPRTEAGKARSASHSQDNNLAQTVMLNCHASLSLSPPPNTPSSTPSTAN